jgi:hypothetical protein
LLTLASFSSLPLFGADGERFSIAIGSHDNLLIASPSGETVADIAGQIVGENVIVGNTSLQVSYGRDANGHLTAVLATHDLNSVSLHFTAGGRSVDSDKAVVTLTFSSDWKGVQIDPGYVGTVEVDSHALRTHSIADDLPITAAALASTPSDVVMPDLAPSATAPAETISATALSSPSPAIATSVTTTAGSAEPSPDAVTPAQPVAASAPASQPTPPPVVPQVAPTTSSTSTETASSTTQPVGLSGAPPLLATQLKPILAPLPNASSDTAQPPPYESAQKRLLDNAPSIVQGGPGAPSQVKLFWSEPVTAPDGTAPPVSPDQIKLVEVYGMVTVTPPGGADQAGTEGMVVPSGSTVRTADGSSAALFMGGVNSARLMPRCELTVTQTLLDSVRNDVIQLQSGAVFSRIGHLPGETENYSVVTPEGTLQPTTSDMLTYRGTPSELREINATTRSGLDLTTRLVAWDPAPSRGLISDVPSWNLGISKSPEKAGYNTYAYCPYGDGPNLSGNIVQQVLTCTGGGAGANAGGTNAEPQFVLQKILETLQPFNKKLQGVLNAINDGNATTAQTDFYQKLTTVFFDVQEPCIIDQFDQNPKQFDHNEDRYRRILRQDLQEFGTPPLTPH